MWNLLEAWVGDCLGPAVRVIDPAAGRGHLLDVVSRHVGPDRAMGIEIDPGLADVRQGLAEGVAFRIGDGLDDHPPEVVPGVFDLVIGNPPFGQLGGATKNIRRSRFEVAGLVRGVSAELLFLERALDLAVDGGLVAFVMPEGFLANQRLQKVRDWVLGRAKVIGIAELPGSVFRGPGLNARTSVVVLRKGWEAARGQEVMLLRTTSDSLAHGLEQMTARARGDQGARDHVQALGMNVEKLAGARWDARYWIGLDRARRQVSGERWRPLGDFVSYITYGPIVTGSRPRHDSEGIAVVRQGNFVEAGLDLSRALRVRPGCNHDPERSRVRSGDLLLPRSGAGALGKNRVAVYPDDEPANVGCFVDLIRLDGINPFYVWLFLKTTAGWGQIEALINGVGTPNINFTEIRSLLVPETEAQFQAEFQARYLAEILPLHRQRLEKPELGRRADRDFRRLVMDLEIAL